MNRAAEQAESDYTVMRRVFPTNNSVSGERQTEWMFGDSGSSDLAFGKNYVILLREADTFDIEQEAMIRLNNAEEPENDLATGHNEILTRLTSLKSWNPLPVALSTRAC